jgi:hypothetical protein
MTRLEANMLILNKLTAYCLAHPDQRFGQILVNVGVVPRPNPLFQVESVDTLLAVEKEKE